MIITNVNLLILDINNANKIIIILEKKRKKRIYQN